MDELLNSIIGESIGKLPTSIFGLVVTFLIMSCTLNYLLEKCEVKYIKKEDIFENKYFIKEDIGLAFTYLTITILGSSSIYEYCAKINEGNIVKTFKVYIDKMSKVNTIVGIIIIILAIVLIYSQVQVCRFKKYPILTKKVSLVGLLLVFISTAVFSNVINIYIMEVDRNLIPMAINNKYFELKDITEKIIDEESLTKANEDIISNINILKREEEKLSKIKDDETQEKKKALENLKKEYLKCNDVLENIILQSKLDESDNEVIKDLSENLDKAHKNFKDKEEKNITNTNSFLLEFLENPNKLNDISIQFIILNIICLTQFILFLKILFSERTSMVLECKDDKRYRCLEVVFKGKDFRIWDLTKNQYGITSRVDKVNRDDIEGFEKVTFLEVADLNQSLNFYKDVFGIQNEISYTDSNGRPYIRFHLFNKLFEIYESNNSNKDILKKVLEQQNIKCKIFDTNITRAILEVKVLQYIPNYNQVEWKEIDPLNRTTSKIEVKDLDGYKYILEDK